MHFIPIKKTKKTSNYYKCFAFASSALLHLCFNSNSKFVEGGGQEYFLPQGAGFPSYATALDAVLLENSFILTIYFGVTTFKEVSCDFL